MEPLVGGPHGWHKAMCDKLSLSLDTLQTICVGSRLETSIPLSIPGGRAEWELEDKSLQVEVGLGLSGVGWVGKEGANGGWVCWLACLS